jgi:hypothetical protein
MKNGKNLTMALIGLGITIGTLYLVSWAIGKGWSKGTEDED